jgi:hypothetical protein
MKKVNFEGKKRIDGLPNKTTKEGKEFWESYEK